MCLERALESVSGKVGHLNCMNQRQMICVSADLEQKLHILRIRNAKMKVVLSHIVQMDGSQNFDLFIKACLTFGISFSFLPSFKDFKIKIIKTFYNVLKKLHKN